MIILNLFIAYVLILIITYVSIPIESWEYYKKLFSKKWKQFEEVEEEDKNFFENMKLWKFITLIFIIEVIIIPLGIRTIFRRLK